MACEDTEEFSYEEESPHYMSLCMLYNFAVEVPNDVAYPIFKERVLQCIEQPEPLSRKAGIKILGHVSASEALVDCIRDDIDEWTDIITKTMVNSDGKVREAACIVVGEFSESVVPDFLEAHEKVMPVLL